MGLLEGKIAKIVIYDKARVIGGTNYDSTGHRWVPNLVTCKVQNSKIIQDICKIKANFFMAVQ